MISNSQVAARPWRMRVAVASQTGRLVDTHFGKADAFLIYDMSAEGSLFVERRLVPEGACAGDDTPKSAHRVEQILDCDAVLTMRMGTHAQEQLTARGILGVEYGFTIEKGLSYVLRQWQEQRALKAKKRRPCELI